MKVKSWIGFVLLMHVMWLHPGDETIYLKMRQKMVEEQIFKRGIVDPMILDAFMRVKRHLFVRPELRDLAYEDSPQDIGEGQSIAQPYIAAVMTFAVEPDMSKKVLEIGTGSGYHTAVLAELVNHVYTIELVAWRAQLAKKRLDAMGYKNISFRVGNGYEGWKTYAPYDCIIVTVNEDHIPQPLIDQLAVGGRMIIPVRYSSTVQELILLEKIDNKGEFKKMNLIPIQMVPMIRGSERK